MGIVDKVRNISRRLIQSYGPKTAKRRLWDSEFAKGQWNCLDSTPGDCVYPFIGKYSNGGSVLDLGCGSGSTANELQGDAFTSYTGVDISDIALAKARERTAKNGRGGRCCFFQFDISGYRPEGQFDVILFRDSIYYVAPSSIRSTLERYSKYLKQEGVFIVRIAGREKHVGIVNTIEGSFDMVEKYLPEMTEDVVLVFR